jgi:hypothetical protein
MFNYSLVLRMLGNAYLGLVGLAQLFAGALAWIAIAEVDRLADTEEGLLSAAYGALGCFQTTLGAIVFTCLLTVGGLGMVIMATLRLRANAIEGRAPTEAPGVADAVSHEIM